MALIHLRSDQVSQGKGDTQVMAAQSENRVYPLHTQNTENSQLLGGDKSIKATICILSRIPLEDLLDSYWFFGCFYRGRSTQEDASADIRIPTYTLGFAPTCSMIGCFNHSERTTR